MRPSDGGGSSPISSYSPGTVASALDAIDVDPDTINQIVQILKESQDGIGESAIDEVPQTSFGGSTHGGVLGYHTHLAHSKVTEAMSMMVEDLMNMEQNVLKYQKSQEYQDISVKLTLEQVLERLVPWVRL